MITEGQERYEKPSNCGFTCIPILEFLNGMPWNKVAYNYLFSCNPSWVRIIPGPNWEVKTDGRLYRVTVYLDSKGNIDHIEQEVRVGLEGGFAHGYALDCALSRQKKVLNDQ